MKLKRQRIEKERAKRAKISKFLDLEAELGSDNEANDEVRKKINKDDEEEDEEGLDSDLEGFVDNAPLGDDDEIEEANAAMREMHNQRVDEDEARLEEKIYQEIILGKNKKRKRGEFELEDLDESSKRKIRRIE